MTVIAIPGNTTVQIAFFFGAFSQIAFGPLIQHPDQRTDNFQMAEFLSGNIHQHIFAPRILITQPLSKVAACCCKFSLRATKLFKQEICQPRIRACNANGILQLFYMSEHCLLR